MAKLLERIRRANAGEGVRIGFGASVSKAVAPRLALMIRLASGSADQLAAAVGAGPDAVLLEKAPKRADLDQALGGSDKAVVGLIVRDQVPADLAELTEAGLDFLILTSTKLPLGVLRQERLTVGLELPLGLDDTRLRALASAPGQFVTTPLPNGTAPTVEDLIELRRYGLFLARTMLAEVPPTLPVDDLAVLRDSGLSGILVDGADMAAVADLRQRLNEMPAPIKAPAERPSAVLPAGSLSGSD
ncbi:MAG TPA: hypothetical protein VHL09_14790 [Dehalococcoidia bacterium]|nr:hypothetical protein [Dehalococcoidia bacterium]